MDPDKIMELLTRIGKENTSSFYANDGKKYFDGNFEIDLLGQKLKADRIAILTAEGRKHAFSHAWFHARIYNVKFPAHNSGNTFNWISTEPFAVLDIRVVEQ